MTSNNIGKLLSDINVWKRHQNNAISSRAAKLTKYLEAFQDGNLESDELRDLIADLERIEEAATNADEIKIVQDLNNITNLIIKVAG